jgi:hypothetical protein
VALGGLLVLLGIAVLVGQALQLDLGRVGWPLFVIVPGLGLLGLGLATPGRLGEVLATVGGVVTMAGLVLLVQNAADRFDTWAYAWTLVLLVGPGSVAGWRESCGAAATWRPAAAGWPRPGWSASGLGGVVRGRGRAQRPPQRGGWPVWPGGPVDPGRPGLGRPSAADGQTAMRSGTGAEQPCAGPHGPHQPGGPGHAAVLGRASNPVGGGILMVGEGAHPSGIDAFRPGPRPGIPTQLQASFRLWLVAVAAGLFETAL